MRALTRASAYRLACGDIVRHRGANGREVTLWREHGAYHVRTHDFAKHERIAWDSARTLTEARRVFRSHVKRFCALEIG
jgi:hypothetical protein